MENARAMTKVLGSDSAMAARMQGMYDDDPPEGEPPPKLLMSDFAAQMFDVERQGSPLWLADRAILMLETGRPGPALTLLRELPGAIRGTAEAIYAEGKEMGRRAAARTAEKAVQGSASPSGPGAAPRAPEALQKAGRKVLVPPSIPAYRQQAVELAEHVARLGAERVAVILGLKVEHLHGLLEGRAAVSKAGMRRLRASH
jgi:hypothetical protein